MNQQIVEDVGGTLYLDHAIQGRPTSATVALRDNSGTVIQASAAAAIDAVNTTVSVAASPGDVTLTLTAVTSVARGRTYLLSNGIDFPEWARVRAVNATSRVVTLDEPIGHAYAAVSASTFQGTRLTYVATAAHAATRAKSYEARWSFVVAGTTYAERTFWDVVRGAWPETILRADQWRQYGGDRASAIREQVTRAGDDFEFALARAQEDVLTDVLQREHDPSLFRTYDAFRKPIAWRLILNRAQLGEGVPAPWRDDPRGWVEHCQELYTEALTEALTTCGSYDADDSDAVGTVERRARLGSIPVMR